MAIEMLPNRGVHTVGLSCPGCRGRSVCFAVILAFVLCIARPGNAESDVVPAVLQVALFNRIFGYDKSLRPPFKMVILYAGEFVDMAGEVQKLFEKASQIVEMLPLREFSRHSSGVSVVYILAKSVPSAVQEFCVREAVLSVSPIPSLAERGEVSLAIGLKEDHKSEIVVHLPRAKLETQNLQMPLLSLARVIR
jgi:hypothetical protein